MVLAEKRRIEEYKKALAVLNLFIEKYINQLEVNKSKIEDNQLDAIVVGSDQVWRPCCVGDVSVYFLDFLKENSPIKRIAYAASFGVDKWEISDEQSYICTELASKFDLITVREQSGIALCRDYLKTDAKLVLDPTMLLEKEVYYKLAMQETQNVCAKDFLFCYILDEAKEKNKIIENVSNTLGLKPYKNLNNNFGKYISSIPITAWLRAFIDAEFVVTDSFHGCVFSIIFNKPFYVIGNKERGMARFNSLLKMFGLQSRLIDLKDIENLNFQKTIDWETVNAILEDNKQKSLKLLADVLSER